MTSEICPHFELFFFLFLLPFDSGCLLADRAQFTAHAQLPSQPLKCQHYNSRPLFTSETVFGLTALKMLTIGLLLPLKLYFCLTPLKIPITQQQLASFQTRKHSGLTNVPK